MNPNSDKSRISLISVSILHSIMEVICNRFPMIAKNIINKLDNITLISCKEASRELNSFLENEKIVWLRIVGLYRGNFIGHEESWKQTIEKDSVDNIKQLALATQKFFKDNSRFFDQWHPFFIAATEGSLELCKHIIEKTGEKNPSMLYKIVRGGLLETQTGYTALHFAAEYGYLNAAKLIINSDVDKNSSDSWGYTPLMYAAAQDDVAVWELFSNNSEIKNPENSWGWEPCHQAALNGNLKVLKRILDKLTDKNPPLTSGPRVGSTPLHFAAEKGQVDACRLIMKCVKNKNPPNADGVTPLHLAAYNGHLEACKVLLEESDDKNPIDIYGNTPANCAIQNNQFRVCIYMAKYLIKNLIVKRFGQ